MRHSIREIRHLQCTLHGMLRQTAPTPHLPAPCDTYFSKKLPLTFVFSAWVGRCIVGTFPAGTLGICAFSVCIGALVQLPASFQDLPYHIRDSLIRPKFQLSFPAPSEASTTPPDTSYLGCWFASNLRLRQDVVRNGFVLLFLQCSFLGQWSQHGQFTGPPDGAEGAAEGASRGLRRPAGREGV